MGHSGAVRLGPPRNSKRSEKGRPNPQTARLVVTADLQGVSGSLTTTYTIRGTGDIIVESSCKPAASAKDLPMLPRFGTELIAAPGFDQIAWYGRGPKETCLDPQFERVGVFRSTVDDECC